MLQLLIISDNHSPYAFSTFGKHFIMLDSMTIIVFSITIREGCEFLKLIKLFCKVYRVVKISIHLDPVIERTLQFISDCDEGRNFEGLFLLVFASFLPETYWFINHQCTKPGRKKTRDLKI